MQPELETGPQSWVNRQRHNPEEEKVFKFIAVSAFTVLAPMAPTLAHATHITPASPPAPPELIRMCSFNSPEQNDNCQIKIVSCGVGTSDESSGICRNTMEVKCGGRTTFRGPYTEETENGQTTVTVGSEPMPGAPFVVHTAISRIPQTVPAEYHIGSSVLDGHCRAFTRPIGRP